MGRNKRKVRKHNFDVEANNQNNGGPQRPRQETDYSPIPQENERLEQYYKTQQIVSEEEWPVFWDYLKRGLATSFRLTGTRSQAKEIQEALQKEYIPFLQNIEIDGQKIPPPQPISWYPDDLAYSLDVPKSVIRRNPAFKKFQQFLVQETDVGNISRQEAVSMIPPLLLDVRPDHKVLDMCAAPGSKTAQLIEALHADENEQPIPTGLIVANDADAKRSHLLVHQLKRLHTPALVVTNLDASALPNIRLSKNKFVQFDRVLCDVPCSGDGTIRKNVLVWSKWNPADGMGLHPLQLRILKRGLKSARVGGRIVYSTCSMNPIENEAVIAAVLEASNGTVKLVDVSDRLPTLQRRKGLSTWIVMDKHMNEVDEMDCERSRIPSTVFPPSEADAIEMNLERCMRIYPHLQDTGGFFIAVLEKVSATPPQVQVQAAEKKRPLSDEQDSSTKRLKYDETNGNGTKTEAVGTDKATASVDAEVTPEAIEADDASEDIPTEVDLDIPMTSVSPPVQPLSKKGNGYMPREEPFTFVPVDNPDIQAIASFFDIQPSFPLANFLVRSESTTKPRTLYFVSDVPKAIVSHNDATRLRFVQTGIRTFVRNESVKTENSELTCSYRLQMDGMQVIAPHLGEARMINGTIDDLKLVLENDYIQFDRLREDFTAQLESRAIGCCILKIPPSTTSTGVNLLKLNYYPLWRAKTSCNLQINKQDKAALYLRLYGLPLPPKELLPIKEQSDKGEVEE